MTRELGPTESVCWFVMLLLSVVAVSGAVLGVHPPRLAAAAVPTSTTVPETAVVHASAEPAPETPQEAAGSLPTRTAAVIEEPWHTDARAIRMAPQSEPVAITAAYNCTGLRHGSAARTITTASAYFAGAHAGDYLCLWAHSENCGDFNPLCRLGPNGLYAQPNVSRGVRAVVCQISKTHYETVHGSDSCPAWRIQYHPLARFLDDPQALLLPALERQHRRWCTSQCNYIPHRLLPFARSL